MLKIEHEADNQYIICTIPASHLRNNKSVCFITRNLWPHAEINTTLQTLKNYTDYSFWAREFLKKKVFSYALKSYDTICIIGLDNYIRDALLPHNLHTKRQQQRSDGVVEWQLCGIEWQRWPYRKWWSSRGGTVLRRHDGCMGILDFLFFGISFAPQAKCKPGIRVLKRGCSLNPIENS